MRSILHPGTPSTEKIQAVRGRVEIASTIIAPGQNLLKALTDALAPFETRSAVLRLKNGAFEPFCYVMPALSTSPDHAVYFSERFDIVGKASLETASVTYGVRDHLPWLHCHAVWIEPDGTRRCGHLLPEDIQVSEPIEASVSILHEVGFSVESDTETNFSLFVPVKVNPHSTESADAPSRQVFAVRLSPNIDVCESLEKFCLANHIEHATILGGVGSTVGAVFEDGRVVEPFVTEMLIRHGKISMKPRADCSGDLNVAMNKPNSIENATTHTITIPAANAIENTEMTAEIDISMVDYLGGISEGRLKRGENPVLVTFELALAVD